MARSTLANPATIRSDSIALNSPRCQGGPNQFVDACRPHPALVLLILEDRAQGEVERALVDPAAAQGGQGRGPVDRLGDARGLVEVLVPQRLHGRGHLPGQRRHRLGGPQPNDGHLPLEVGCSTQW